MVKSKYLQYIQALIARLKVIFSGCKQDFLGWFSELFIIIGKH
jgi:hypothetical protein